MTRTPNRAARSLRLHSVIGAVALLLLIGGIGGWAMTTELAGAVVAPGTVVVESNLKKVQHPTGGVVGELLVRDGDRVNAGDVLVRLDETVARANLTIVIKGLAELAAREARLSAERDGRDRLQLSSAMTRRADDREVAEIVAGETRLFELRRSAREGQKAQLIERVGQLKEEVEGLSGQERAKQREIELINRELDGVRDLWRKNLIPISRLTALEREAVRIDGERHQLIAATAQAKGKITETQLQILQIDQDLRSEVARELREIQAKSAELIERMVAAEDQLRRVEMRAPQSGVVHQLAIHTVGGVIGPGELLMLIVPEGDALTVEVNISPQEIDRVTAGQTAVLRFAAFNQRTTPAINGVVDRVAADVAHEPKTGAAYYTSRITMPEAELARLGDLRLLPGMPVEAFIQTDYRSALSYLVKPIEEQIAKAFRER